MTIDSKGTSFVCNAANCSNPTLSAITFVAPPSRRLSGGRLTRPLARDALAIAGKMPPLLPRSNSKPATAPE
jgi:hypothetical protein